MAEIITTLTLLIITIGMWIEFTITDDPIYIVAAGVYQVAALLSMKG